MPCSPERYSQEVTINARRWRSPAYLMALTRKEWLPPCPLIRYSRSKPRPVSVSLTATQKSSKALPAAVQRPGKGLAVHADPIREDRQRKYLFRRGLRHPFSDGFDDQFIGAHRQVVAVLLGVPDRQHDHPAALVVGRQRKRSRRSGWGGTGGFAPRPAPNPGLAE